MNKTRIKKTEREKALLDQAIQSFKRSSGLGARINTLEPRQGIGNRPDALISVSVGSREWILPSLEKTLLTNDVLGFVIAETRRLKPQPGVLITRYVTPQQAEKLRLANVQFLDTAGNAFLNQPPLYVFVTGKRPAEDVPRGKTARAFTATGVKVLFALLCKPVLITESYREIAATASVSLGAVSQVLDDLKRAGYMLDRGEQGRALNHHEALVRRWVEAYAERLRPKLLLSHYSAEKADWWREIHLENMNACWGGEVAAAKLTGYLRPQVKTIYAPNKLAAPQVKFGFRQDRNGDIEILKKFWAFESSPAHPDTAPALLVYADLITSGDDRNIETAKMIYDRYIARSFGEA